MIRRDFANAPLRHLATLTRGHSVCRPLALDLGNFSSGIPKVTFLALASLRLQFIANGPSNPDELLMRKMKGDSLLHRHAFVILSSGASDRHECKESKGLDRSCGSRLQLVHRAGCGLIFCLFNQFDLNIDIPSDSFGIWARIVGFIDQGLGDLASDAGEPDIEPSGQVEPFVPGIQVDFGFDVDACRQLNLALVSRKFYCAFETSGPRSSKQMLRAGPDSI